MADTDFLAELRTSLLGAADQQFELRRRRRLRRRAAAFVAAAAIVVGAVLGLGLGRTERSASADVDVVVQGNDLILRLTDLETRPEEIEAAAERFGLDLRIHEVPVGPSNVGRFIQAVGDLPPDIKTLGGEQTFTGFRVPKGWSHPITVTLGRPAERGERWQAASDARAPGEPLECQPLLGRSVRSVVRAIAERGRFDEHWLALPRPGVVEDPAPYSSWKVVQIQATDAHELWLVITEDGSWPFPGDPADRAPHC